MEGQRVLKRSTDVRDDERLRRVQEDDGDVVGLGGGELRVRGPCAGKAQDAGRQERDDEVALPGHVAWGGVGGNKGAWGIRYRAEPTASRAAPPAALPAAVAASSATSVAVTAATEIDTLSLHDALPIVLHGL